MKWPKAIMHLDMDAFYVNVHILDYPADKGVPLIVGGQPESRGVVASASYEARAFGVRSAMPCSRAVRLCPQVKIVAPNWERIRACSGEVMAVLRTFGVVEQMSVDEAYVDLTQHANPEQAIRQIQQAVQTETNLPCSVGLATSKLVAKVASDFDKPQGCTVVLPDKEAAFLAPLPVRSIWGIGPKTEERLGQMEIHTCGELAVADLGVLQAKFGQMGAELQLRARGIDSREVQSERGPSKSISQERTFAEDVNDGRLLRQKLWLMCQKVARSLQAEQLVAHTVTVKFREPDFTTFTRQRSVIVGVDEAQLLFRVADGIFRSYWHYPQALRLLGVGVGGLVPVQDGRQLAFTFD